jgi:hypothetical protein
VVANENIFFFLKKKMRWIGQRTISFLSFWQTIERKKMKQLRGHLFLSKNLCWVFILLLTMNKGKIKVHLGFSEAKWKYNKK